MINLIDKILFEAFFLSEKIYKRTIRKSSNIKSVRYDSDTEILQITFHGSSTYQYYDVPERVYKDFLNASSKGRYCYYNIAYEYDYDRIK